MEFTSGEPTFKKELIEAGDLAPLYDPKATIVIKKGYYHESPANIEYANVDADDISRNYWRVGALQETNNRNSRTVDAVKDYLVENYKDIGEEHANEIANLLGVDLSKTLEVVFDVTIRATISVPVGKDVDDLSVYDFDIEISSNESEYEIEESEADIDSIRNYFQISQQVGKVLSITLNCSLSKLSPRPRYLIVI